MKWIKPQKEYTEERIKHMVGQLIAGAEEPIPDLIDAHIEFAIKRSHRFRRLAPHKGDDIIASAENSEKHESLETKLGEGRVSFNKEAL